MDQKVSSHIFRHVSLRQLQIFESIVKTGSYTRAAEELYLTQPTVSMQIKKLEDNLGVPLFEHINKKVFLTEAGKVVDEHTRSVLDSFNNMEMEIADLKGMKTGLVRLAVVTTAKYFAPRALGQFCEQYPGVDVSLKVTNRERLIDRLANNMDDIYIMGRPPQSSDVSFVPYLANPLVVVASRNHPLAASKEITPHQLADHPFIIREVGSGTRMATENFFEEHKVKLKIRMELGSNEAIKHAIDAGLGVSVLSKHTLALEGENGRLKVLDVKGFPISWQWHLGYSKGKRLSVVVRTFMDFLSQKGSEINQL